MTSTKSSMVVEGASHRTRAPSRGNVPVSFRDKVSSKASAVKHVSRRWIEPFAVVLILGAAWEGASRLGLVPTRDFPPPTAILKSFIQDVHSPILLRSVAESLSAWALSLAIVTMTAVPIGLAIGSVRVFDRATKMLIELVRPIPTVAFLPLMILLYGTGPQLATVLSVLAAFWPLLIQTIYGARDVDPVARDTGRAYGLSQARQYWHIVIPSALPYVATGMRLAATIALVVAIAASLVAGGSGLGAAISNAADSGAPALMYARILVAGLLGLAVTLFFSRIERHLLRWHHSHREMPA